ncbi:MAG: DUF4147 domain-containing protein [Nitrospirota bacterium]
MAGKDPRIIIREIFNKSLPLPDENGLKAAREIVRMLKEADKKTLVICLISGGGSALLVAPYNNINRPLQYRQ